LNFNINPAKIIATIILAGLIMQLGLLHSIEQLNPWLKQPATPIVDNTEYRERIQTQKLLLPEWDDFWTIFIGPRRAGKTTLGKHLCQTLITQKRYTQLIYLNCDYLDLRQWLQTPHFIDELQTELNLKNFILFIDEVQRLESPGLLLKAIIDLKLPIKLLATGSSQLEIKSKVQEHLTGRNFTSLILPFSNQEWPLTEQTENHLLYGCYPKVIQSQEKELILSLLYKDYIQKDIVEILQLAKPDVLQRLITLLTHSSGQLVNYNQLAIDCQVTFPTIKHYLDILEKTYVIARLSAFSRNKRTEVTSNPIYYFIDNGFRNYALNNFSAPQSRTDLGLLVENTVFQELFKYREQHYLHYDIQYWRSKSGAEVDFILYFNEELVFPVEVKYRTMKHASLSRSYRSFIENYKPKIGAIITKDFIGKMEVDGCAIHFIPLVQIEKLFALF
jgi:hypothetical protein